MQRLVRHDGNSIDETEDVMAIFDERFNGLPKKEIRNRDQRFTRTDVQDNSLRRSAAPVAVTTSDVRTRGSVPADPIPAPKTYRISTGPTTSVEVDEQTWKNRQRNIAAREAGERIAEENRRRTEQEHAERRRLAEQRDKEYREQHEIALSIARTLYAQAIETDLTKNQILSTCEAYALNEADVKAVGARLKAMGYEHIPSMWDYEIRRYLEERKN